MMHGSNQTLQCPQTELEKTKPLARGQIILPALGQLQANQNQDQIGDLKTQQHVSQTLFVLEMRPGQAQVAFEISEHFFNPETVFVPAHSLFGVGERSAQIPDFVTFATDDQVEANRLLVPVIHLREPDGGALRLEVVPDHSRQHLEVAQDLYSRVFEKAVQAL